MSKIPSHTKTWLARRSRRRSGWRAALLLALAVGVLGQGAPARAAPASPDLVTIQRALIVNPLSLTLCPNERQPIKVSLVSFNYSSGTGSVTPVSRTYETGLIEGRIQNSNIASLGAGQLWTRVRPSGGVTNAHFYVTGRERGDTTVTLSSAFDQLAPLEVDELAPLLPPGATRDVRREFSAQDETVAVHVGCKYIIRVVSTWQLPGERTLTVTGVLDAEVTPDRDGKFTDVPATLRSFGFWEGPCPGVVAIQQSKAYITGSVGNGDLTVNIRYDPAQTTTTEGCVGKSSTGPGQPLPLTFTTSANGGSTSALHTLSTYVTVTDTATISVVKVSD